MSPGSGWSLLGKLGLPIQLGMKYCVVEAWPGFARNIAGWAWQIVYDWIGHFTGWLSMSEIGRCSLSMEK